VYEENSTDTSVVGFKGPDSIADNMHYKFPDADPAVNQIWTFSATAANVSDIGLSYVYDAFEFVIDGGGSEITIGIKGDLEIPFGFVVEQVTILADQSGSIVIDIWMEELASFPPTDSDSITSVDVPTISSATNSRDIDLPSWVTTLVAGEILRYNVDSCTDIERATISLKGYRTF